MAGNIQLPPPVKEGGVTLMQALSERKTSRDFQAKELSPRVLSSLLWAACGINRPDGRRTSPSGLNVQDIDLYVMLPNGVYIYNAYGNSLEMVNEGDFRSSAGKQGFTKTAPLNLFMVQNLEKAMKASETDSARHGGIHAGCVVQNVYLFCAKEKLGCVVRDYINREALAKVLKLKPTQKIIIAQTVGYPPDDGIIGPEGAKRIALGHAGCVERNVRRLKCELDIDDGVKIYEIEFKYGRYEYEYDIDAKTGTIIKSKKEYDD
jgi:SagB-type dehydrogenase family enzyme